jgi:hypothetical protein
MEKMSVVNLIKYYIEKNDDAFRDEAYKIVVAFNKAGDYDFADYIMALLSDKNTFIPQVFNDEKTS